MFIEQNHPTPPTNPLPVEHPQKTSLLSRKELFIIAIVAAVIVIVGGGWWYLTKVYWAPKPIEQPVVEEPVNQGLPGTLNPGEENSNSNQNEGNPDLKGETVTFGAFYKKPSEALTVSIPGVKLPLNTKAQVVNYYEVARKINLDPAIANLNQDGFGMIANPFPKSTDDFLGSYYELNQRSVPIVVTSDFLLYYYQNSLKQIYKDIEASFFYESLWKITNDLYEEANGRYQERRQKLGVASDSLLEAERLEAAYFAAGLVLLSPENDQVNTTEDLNDTRRFKPSEANRFNFTPPTYLSDDLNKEIQLIKEAKATAKSPVLLYERDYRDFKIPDEYSQTAKLKNFYLASRWYTSLFPLNFRDGSCSNCLLDREDWIINQSAAQLIAADMSANQSLKNEWAKIYKVISFFSGLRSELTYLHYESARSEEFGEATLEEVLGVGSFDRLKKIQSRVAALQFTSTEGAYSRTNAADKPILGMRLLQTPYWPSRSFYDRLTYDAVGYHNHPLNAQQQRASYVTACDERSKLYRCKGLGFDVLAPVLNQAAKSKFLLDNIDYERYGVQSQSIRKDLSVFDDVKWHNNNFWTVLFSVTSYINEKIDVLAYQKSDRWFERKISSGLAALTNLSLPADTWQMARDRQSGGLETNGNPTSLNYIEPDAVLADELVANTKMLFDALVSLGVVKDTDPRFTDLSVKMSASRSIIRKELSGETISPDDYQFIADFVSQYRIEKAGSKQLSIQFNDPKNNRSYQLKQSIGGLKLLLLIYEKDGKKILAVGPVFGYKEQ